MHTNKGAVRRWMRLALAILLVIATAGPALANSELHPGGRLFFPLWDVSGADPGGNPFGGRLTFIILTRLAQFFHTGPNDDAADSGSYTVFTYASGLPVSSTPSGPPWFSNNCKARNTAQTPSTGVNAVHFQYYGKTCNPVSEIIWMSCADIDLIVLSGLQNTAIPPRDGFSGVLGQGDQGALDVHFVDDDSQQFKDRMQENSLMGHAVISDVKEGWAAQYPAASAKSTQCDFCAAVDGGSRVGYEPYPMEVFIPWVLPDGSGQGGGSLTNLLSLWAPGVQPGDSLSTTAWQVTAFWYDGRERPHRRDFGGHSVINFLGSGATPIDSRFNVTNYFCGHINNGAQAENDGKPRDIGDGSTGPCVPPDDSSVTNDTVHQSDDFDTQYSTPLGWWDIIMTSDAGQPKPAPGAFRSGRGLVGVVLMSGSGGEEGKGAAEAIRLWHKDPCEIGSHGVGIAYGPPHVRDRLTSNWSPEYMVYFNAFTFAQQGYICENAPPLAPGPDFLNPIP